MTHRYAIGQMLDLRPAPRLSNRPAGPCEVIARLPHESGPVLYRVKSLREASERVVDEIDLTPSAQEKPAIAEGPDARSIAIARR
jgi:hypothetical protein